MIVKSLYLDSRGHDEDPLTKAMAPPPNESEVERQVRLAAEREAQKRSDAIDEELDRQRTLEKRTKCIRILLLGEQTGVVVVYSVTEENSGQSESGP